MLMMLSRRIVYLLVIIAVTNSTDVLKLTDTNFDTSLAEKQLALVDFHTAKCPECAKLEQEFVKAAAILRDHDPPVIFAKVNCYLEGKKICKKHGISHYPDIKIFKHGVKVFEYNGPQDSVWAALRAAAAVDGMVQYVRKNMPLISKELMSVDDVQAFIDRTDYSVIGFFERRDSVIFERYEMFASTLNEHFRFGHTFGEDVLQHYGYKNTFVAFRCSRLQSKLEPDTVEYDGVYTPVKMRDWLLANMFGLVGHRTNNTALFFTTLPLIIVYLDIDYVKNAKSVNYWRNRILKVAQTFKESNITFAMSDIQEFEQELSELSVAAVADVTRLTVVGRDEANRTFIMNDDFSVKHLIEFVQQLQSGTLTMRRKKPSSQDKKSFVKTVEADTFDEIVNDPARDVLINFCTAQEEHCQHLAPTYDELAYKLKDENSIVIAKMDPAVENIPEPYQIHGFPAIYFAAVGSKLQPKLYKGSLGVDDFVKFLVVESTQSLQSLHHDATTRTVRTEL